MARITLGALTSAVRGRMGPLDFQGSSGGPRVRIHCEPGPPATSLQLEQREAIARSALLWGSIKAAYEPWAELDPRDPLLSPMLLHHAASVARIRAGLPWNLAPYELPPWTANAWKARSLALGEQLIQVSHNYDDSTYLHGGAFDRTTPNTRIGLYATERNDCWSRFLNVQVPQGAPLSHAHMIYTPRDTEFQPNVYYRIVAQDQDDADQIANTAAYLAMDWTTAEATGTFPNWTLNVPVDGPDLTAVLQEVFDRPGWTPGGAVGIASKDPGTAEWRRRPFHYGHDPAKAGQLHLEWGEAPTPPPDVWLRAEWDAGLASSWDGFALLRRDAGAWAYILEELYGEPLTPNTFDFQVTPGLDFHDLYMVLRESIAPVFQELPSIRCVPDGTWQFPHV